MSTNHTPNYNLSQWEKSDKVLMDDFNADNAKIDAALAAQAAALAQKADASAVGAVNTQLALRNCRAVTQAYTGNGSVSKTFTFTGKPLLVLIQGHNQSFFCLYGSPVGYGVPFSSGTPVSVSWTSRAVTLTSFNSDPTFMCNYKADAYILLALIEP